MAPTQREIDKAYTRLAARYDRIAEPLHRDRIRISSLVREAHPGRLLIVGIGTGLDLPHLAFVPEIFGLDFNSAMLERARQRAFLNRAARLLRADAQCLPFDDEQFDAVMLVLILAIVPQPEIALVEAIRVVRCGGHLVVYDKFAPAWLRSAPGFQRLSRFVHRHGTRLDLSDELVRIDSNLELIREFRGAAWGYWKGFLLQKI
ncbi:MAG: methyltransferase domain-containing protein [Acidobacteria bacterium]|nr:methyltransferase domain-containing protein [Acidobacteriota bacterium]